MIKSFRNYMWIPLAVLVMSWQVTASAGFMDKINAAAEKMKQASQPNQPKSSGAVAGETDEDPDRPLDLYKQKGFKGSCEGKRSATCMDYMEAMDYCMAPVQGYRSKLWIDRLEKKLKEEKLSDKVRKNLEEDLAAFREAYKNKSNDPTIAGQKNSQRYLSDASEEDQVWVNTEFNQFNAKIMNKCEGADHMGVGHRTEYDTGPKISGDEAIKQLREERAKERAPFDCMKKAGFVRWAIMADLMEKRMNERKLSGKERADWEADIASLREFAEKAEGGMPKAVDPSNPMRAMMRLTDPADQMAISTETSQKTQELLDSCSAKNNTGAPKQRKVRSGGLVDHSTSPANPDAPRHVEKAGRGNYKTPEQHGGSLSAYLGATKVDAMVAYSDCSRPGVGHLAQVTADTLQEKLDASKGISGQKRQEWEEDIAAWRAAAKSGKDSPNPPDPNNPYH